MRNNYRVLVCCLLSIFAFSACNNVQEKQQTQNENQTSTTEISDLSIYQLSSTWKTQDDENIQFADLKGNVLVVVMIYTSCKAACPRLVADMKAIAQKVPTSETPLKYVLISIDPKNDTPARLKSFAKENGMEDDHWLFLTGTEADVREFANVVAVKYSEISPIDFSHSNIISVFNTSGELVHQMEGLAVDNTETVKAIKHLVE